MGVRILVVDNDPVSVDRLLPALKAEGYMVTDLADWNAALVELGRREYDVVVAELDTRAEKEVAFLGRALEISSGTEVIIVSSSGVDTAVAAMKMGAFHFLPKPYEVDDLVLFVRRAVEKRVLQLEVEALRAMVRDKRLPPLIGKSLAMQKIKRDIARVAPLDCTVLIRGETGTGKELVSRTIHLMSTRADKQFLRSMPALSTLSSLPMSCLAMKKRPIPGRRESRREFLRPLPEARFFLMKLERCPAICRFNFYAPCRRGQLSG